MGLFGQRSGRGIAAIALIGGFVGSGAAVVVASSVPEAGATVASPCPAPVISGGTATVTCSYNGTTGSDGSAQSWTVPAGVTQATIDVYGAQGANQPTLGQGGGAGGEAKGTFAVTPGSIFQVNVGGQPFDTAAGFNGGGSVGSVPAGGGGGGGGASDVRDGAYGLANRIAVAGGGGGYGFEGNPAFQILTGGSGGADGGNGGNGDPTQDGCLSPINACGLGGSTTNSTGGSAGTTTACTGGTGVISDTPATSGATGIGGNGGFLVCAVGSAGIGEPLSGGGGGGGWFGGGGGAGYEAFTSSGTAQFLGEASGGGGSGFIDTSATSPSFNTGIQSGNGKVVITYTVPIDDDLVISQPSNLTNVNATSPSGAVVTYPLPAVSDPDDTTLPTPSCAPVSGSTFAIGTTTVNCSVSDSDDTNSPQTTSFTVSVLGAAAQLANLQHSVIGVGPGTSLYDKLGQAQTYLAAKNIKSTCSTSSAFISEVKAQTGKSIAKATAASLIASATRIRAVLGC